MAAVHLQTAINSATNSKSAPTTNNGACCSGLAAVDVAARFVVAGVGADVGGIGVGICGNVHRLFMHARPALQTPSMHGQLRHIELGTHRPLVHK